MAVDFFMNGGGELKPLTPAWTVLGKKSKDNTLKWFGEAKENLQKLSEDRIQACVNNILWYTGEYTQIYDRRSLSPGRQEQPLQKRVLPRVFNHLFDITEQRVSRLSRYKPSFDTVPTNRETKDYKVARLIKVALQAFARRVQMDFLMQDVERWAAVCGEILIGTEWNPHIGDRKSFRSVERIGDVDAYIKAPWTYFPAPKTRWEDVDWCLDIKEVIHIDEARKKYGKNSLEPDNKKNIFDFNEGIDEKREDEVVVWRVIQLPCEYLPNGGILTVINNTIVGEEYDRYPYSHYGFPWERHTDIDVPGRLFGVSFYQQLKPMQNAYNRLTSVMVRNALLVGHPHILMRKGAAKIESFGNAPTVIEYNSPEAPTALTWNSIPQEFFQLRKEIKEEMGQISGIMGVSRGAPPSGARAASMLKFYEEQEEQRASTQIIKHNELIRRIYLKAASIIGDYYPTTSKERMIRVVGKENQYLIESFEDTKISSEYDVIIVNSTGFSESMAGRLEEVQLLLQVAPNILSPDQIADVLELKNPQKAYDISTAALKESEEENQMALDGKELPQPQPYQDLIVHWRTHMILLNNFTWEMNVPKDVKEMMYEHMTATEMLMQMKAQQNAAFAEILGALPGYPAFYNLQPEPPKPEGQQQQPAMPPMGAMPMPGMPQEAFGGGPGVLPELPSVAQDGLPQSGPPPPIFPPEQQAIINGPIAPI